MNTFANAVETSMYNQTTTTENGMVAYKNTSNALVDLFGQIGSARNRDIGTEFFGAYAEDEELACRILLWARDIREGAGERKTFRNLLAKLESVNPVLAGRLMPKIPELGRWDDLFTYTNPLNRAAAFGMISKALVEDKNGLAAKWMPRKGSVAVELRNFMGLSPKAYRKLLVGLTDVVETKMCAKEWDSINFSHVPSLASARYQKAFGRNAPVAYSTYLAELAKPESERDPKVKINAGAVYPYDVIKSLRRGNAAAADAQWKSLPNYIQNGKILPLVDVSGSMGVGVANDLTAMDIAVSLGMYCAMKNTGPFKDLFLTFSRYPEFVKLSGDSLKANYEKMVRSNWDMNTNLEAAMREIVKVAKGGNVSQEDMPDFLLILSDMQFDQATNYSDSARKMIRREFEMAGYKVPTIIFWNLNTRHGANSPVKFDSKGDVLVSGFSPTLVESILSADPANYNPYNMMMNVIMKARYDF